MLASVLDAHGRGSDLPHRRHRARLRHQRALRARAAPTWWRPTRATSRFTLPLARRRCSSRTSRRTTSTTTATRARSTRSSPRSSPAVPDDGGPVVVCGDDPALVRPGARHRAHRDSPTASPSLRRRASLATSPGRGQRLHAAPARRARGGEPLKQNPGRHNVSNGAGVLTLISLLGLDVELAADALAELRRRSSAASTSSARRRGHRGRRLRPSSHRDRRDHQGRLPSWASVVCTVLFQPPPLFARAAVHRGAARRVRRRVRRGRRPSPSWTCTRRARRPCPACTGKTFLTWCRPRGILTAYVPRRIDMVPHMLEMPPSPAT